MSRERKIANTFFGVPALFDDFVNRELFNWENSNFSSTRTPLPSVNIKETFNGYEVEVAAPGMEKNDFNLALENNLLTISSVRKQVQDKYEEDYTRKEFSYQSFSRTFELPKNVVDEEGITARYENGILHLSIPKREEVKQKAPRMIEIA